MTNPFGLNADEKKFVELAASIGAQTLATHAADVDANRRFPTEGIQALARSGLLGLCLPKELGGQAQAHHVLAAVAEELAQSCASTAMIYVMHVVAAQTVAGAETLAGRDDIARELASGEKLASVALSERGSRSQFWMPLSRLDPQGDDYVTSAQKLWATSANHADYFVAIGLKPGASQPAGFADTVLYLARRGNGVRTAREFDGIGLRGNDSNPLTFEAMTVKRGDLLSALGEGTQTALGPTHFPWYMVGSSAVSLGLCRAATTATAAHLTGNAFEPTNSRLCDLPNLRARLGEMATRTERARAMLGHAIREMHAGSEETPVVMMEARLTAIQTAAEVTDLAMRAAGGTGLLRGRQVERLFRDARAGLVMSPTADLLEDLVGKVLTGLPLF